MKIINRVLLTGASLFVSLNLLHAQSAVSLSGTAQPTTEATDATSVMLQALEQVPPLPPQDSPAGGNFYTVQHGKDWPPLPGNVLNLPFWSLGDGFFVLDDRNVDYAELQAEAEAAAALVEAAAPMMQMSMMSSLSSSYAYANPVYLTNMAAVIAYDGSTTASFSIAGGTNFVPYDILMTTNLLSPIDWTWLGIGYTSNNYTFYGQASDNAFYRLAKPSKTMTVPWGADNYGQCDVWSGITNAMQVTGGREFSLALLNDGTVMGWGYNGASSSALVPTNLTGVVMIASGWMHNAALLTNGTVQAWGDNFWGEINVPAGLTNVTVISAHALHSLALRSDGTVVAWGYNGFGETNVPAGLSNVVAIAAGYQFNLAVTTNGTVTAWGANSDGQCTIPAGLSNVVDVAAGTYHSLALLNDGTVAAWGDNDYGESSVPVGLSNVVAIAAGGDPIYADTAYSMALKSDGTVVTWGDDDAAEPLSGLSNVISIAAGVNHALAIRTGPPTPVVTLEPFDHYQVVGSTATFTARGAGLYGVTYQWQTNGVNLSGATNATLTVTNVQTTSATNYAVVVTDNGGMGSIVSSNAGLYVITPPVITYQSTPTNIACLYGNYVSLAATATAPGQANGFPLSYQWKYNGTNISGATGNAYGFPATNAPGTYSLVAANAAGNVSASWQVINTNVINVTNDLLLVYNTNSADSATVLNYYLAHRPMIGGANVLGIGCSVSPYDIISSMDFTNQILIPYFNWLTNNPTKHPQYLVLFLDVPARVNDGGSSLPSVQYQLANDIPGIQPFVTSINMNGTNDCIGYINKLAAFGTNGQLVISASAGGYANTNYILDGVRTGTGYGPPPFYNGDYSGNGYIVSNAITGLTASGVPSSAINFNDGLDTVTTVITNGGTNYTLYYTPQITNAANVSGYICWGQHSALGGDYAINGTVTWTGNSSWWIIETVESFNGLRGNPGQGTFLKWSSANAFGGTNYSNTPIGMVSHVEEPFLYGIEDSSVYFGLWAAGKNFAICAWNSSRTPYFQAVGDPFVTK